MKRIIFFFGLILFIAFSSPLFAAGIQEERERSLTQATAPVQTGSSVWKISNNDGNFMFLGGSIHVLREKDFPLPEEFDLAFYQSERLVLEADVKQMEDPQVWEYLSNQIFLPDELTLRDILNDDAYELLSFVCSQYGFSIDDVARIKPSMVISILSLGQIEEYGFLQQGVDFYYLDKAANENRPVFYLETVQSQIDMLVTMGDGYESEYVLYSLQDMANTEAGLELLLIDWREGTSSIMEELLLEMKETWPQMYKSLITDRHDAWIPQIEEFITSGHVYLVIAGVLHKHGPDGLLQMLENLDYNIEQITNNK
ncbi:MAG: TraB/GumN family protein [Treponema sp.]|jgi:uncharacterized protein YbaP (TraB family)|nr:TraB/GumN family protein [Treponema sp.]